MGLKNFSIVLDSPTGAFYAGTVVSGRVLLSLDKPKTIRALNVKIEGVAKVSFRDEERVTKSDGDSKTVMVDFTAEEEYFSTKFKLAGRGTGETEIPIGEYSYPFSYTLPPLLPSSFEGEYGSIRYSVKAVIDRPWKFDHETKTSFIVVAPLDLNYNANAKDPVKIEDEKNFCCFCCTSGPLQLVVSLPHSGYVAGQSIPLTIEVDNASNVEVDKIICKLKKEMKWIANNPRRNEKRQKDELVKLSLEGVRCNGSKSWTQQLTVPSDMPFVNFEPCSIIGIDFSLKVTAEVSGCHSDLDIEIPLTIGSVAIGSSGSVPPPSMGPPSGVVPPGGPGFSPAVTPSQPGFSVTPGPPQQYFPGSPYPPVGDQQPPVGGSYPPPAPIPTPGAPNPYPSASGPAPYPAPGSTMYPSNGQQPATYPMGAPGQSPSPYPTGVPGQPPAPYPTGAPGQPPAPYPSGVPGTYPGQTTQPPGTAPYPPPGPPSGTAPYPSSAGAPYQAPSQGSPYPPVNQPPSTSPYSSAPYPSQNVAPSAPTMIPDATYPPTSEATPLMGQPT